MKKVFILGLLIVSFVGRLAYADTTDQKIKTDSADLKHDYQVKIDKDLKHIQHKIDKIKADTTNQVNADLKAQADKLAAQKADADQKLLDIENSTGDAWKDLQKGMDKAVHDLRKSVDKASHDLTTATPVAK